jgi:hypothetical protein
MTILIISIAVILMLACLAFIVLMLPGVPCIFLISLIYAIADHFTHISGIGICILGVIALLSVVVDQSAGLIAARYGGARGKTFLFGIAGAIIGTIVLPVFGGFIGLFIGIMVGELVRNRTHQEALKAATAGVIGSLTGMIINICLGVASIALFLIFTLPHVL